MDALPAAIAVGPFSFVTLAKTSDNYILSIRVIRFSQEFVQKFFDRQVTYRAIALMWASLAPVIALTTLFFNHRAWNITLLSTVAYSVLVYLLLYYPRIAWTKLQEISGYVEALLPDEAHKVQLADWLHKRLNLRIQGFLALGGAALALSLALTFVYIRKFDMLGCLPYFLAATLIGGFGINAAWWLCQAPSFGRLILRAEKVNLDWPGPAETLGISESRKLILKSFRRAFVGAFVTLAPIVITVLLEPTSTAGLSAIFGVGVITFSTAVVALLVPEYWLTLIVSHFQSDLFTNLRASLLTDDPENPRATTYERLAIYRLLATQHTFSWDVKSILSITLASLSAFAALTGLVVALTH